MNREFDPVQDDPRVGGEPRRDFIAPADKRAHVIACADEWMKTQGLLTYTELADQRAELIAALEACRRIITDCEVEYWMVQPHGTNKLQTFGGYIDSALDRAKAVPK